MVVHANWEEILWDFIEQNLNPASIMTFASGSRLPFNAEQRRAVRSISNPTNQVPQTIRDRNNYARISGIPREQSNTYRSLSATFPLSHLVFASDLIIGPPGTGKTHVICAGSIHRVFNRENLRKIRSPTGRPIRLFIATFSNSGSYRIYEKFHEISLLANTPNFHERIKLVQSETALLSPNFDNLTQTLNLNQEDFTIPNRNNHRALLRNILIFIGTTDSLSILNNSSPSPTIHGIIYDEASQITVPQFFQIIPTQTSINSICVVGDDAQLPPVTTLIPLGVSALTYLQGMNLYENSPIPESRRNELLRQYRMHPAIAQLTQTIVRAGRIVIPDGNTTDQDYHLPNYDITNLSSNFATLPRNIIDILDLILRPEHPLVIIDTSNITNALDRRVGRSRINETEAQLALGISRALSLVYPNLTRDDIILTAPYRPQVNLFLGDFFRTGTVHQYQGQEAASVIYSLTFARPRSKSEFFSQVELMYVGLSRAQRKLIIMGNSAAMNHPDPSIQTIRNAIFSFQYRSGSQGYPPYTLNPVCHLDQLIDDQFLNHIVSII